MIITPIRCDGPPSPYQSLKNRTPSRPWSYYRRTKQLGHLPACHWTTTVPMGSCIARPPQDAMRAIMVEEGAKIDSGSSGQSSPLLSTMLTTNIRSGGNKPLLLRSCGTDGRPGDRLQESIEPGSETGSEAGHIRRHRRQVQSGIGGSGKFSRLGIGDIGREVAQAVAAADIPRLRYRGPASVLCRDASIRAFPKSRRRGDVLFFMSKNFTQPSTKTNNAHQCHCNTVILYLAQMMLALMARLMINPNTRSFYIFLQGDHHDHYDQAAKKNIKNWLVQILVKLGVCRDWNTMRRHPSMGDPIAGYRFGELYGFRCLGGDQCSHERHRRECRCLAWNIDHWLPLLTRHCSSGRASDRRTGSRNHPGRSLGSGATHHREK